MSRPILPANDFGDSPETHEQTISANPSDFTGASSSADPGGSGNGRGGRGGAKPTYSKRGKITIVACVPCRKRKTKCDGKRPACGQCASRDSPCHYDMTDDQRKLTFLRDNVEHLQEKSNVLEGLLHTIQAANEEEASEIYRRLRLGTDVQMVAEQIQAGRLLSGVARGESDVESSASKSIGLVRRCRQYDDLMRTLATSNMNECKDVLRRIRQGEDVSSIMEHVTAGDLSPQRLIRRSPEKATAGPEADFSSQESTFAMVKGASIRRTHAFSGGEREFEESQIDRPWTTVTKSRDLVEYLLAMYFTWQHSFFQSFPEKLFRADMEAGRTKYCSSMLVNAICASGCFLCDTDKLQEMDPQGDISTKFYDAAVAQLDSRKPSTICTTAALYLISYYEGTRGRLSNLWMFSGRSSLMAVDINLHLSRTFQLPDDPAHRQELFNERKARCHAFWGAFHVDQMTAFTLGRLPNLNAHGVTQELPEISEEEDMEPWSAPEFGTLPQRPGARGSTFTYCTLLSKIINSTLLMFFAPSVPLSGSLLVDEYEKYHSWYNSLPRLLSSTVNAPPHVLCLHMYYHVAILHLFRPFLKATIDNSDLVPRDICRQAANAISELWAQHKSLYGLRGIYMFQVHCLLGACTIHIINIPSIASTRYFTEACKTFQDLLPRNEWARSSLKVLRSLVEKWALILPLEAEEALCRDKYSEEGAVADDPMEGVAEHRQATNPSLVFDEDVRQNGPSPVDQAQQLARNSPHLHSGAHSMNRPQPPGPQLMGAGAGLAQIQSISGKRPSVGEVPSPSQVSQAGSQKKQRLMASHAGGSNSPAESASSEATKPSPANYLYSPMAGQPAPMLVPVAGAVVAGRGRGRPGHSSGVSAASPAQTGSSTPLSVSSGGGQGPGQGQSQAPSQGQATSKAVKRDGDEMSGVQTGVEGLSFGDDWRDPFMGYLGQEE